LFFVKNILLLNNTVFFTIQTKLLSCFNAKAYSNQNIISINLYLYKTDLHKKTAIYLSNQCFCFIDASEE